MSLPEYVVPVLSIAGPAALVLVVMRCFPLVARAVMVLVAGIAAIVTNNGERRAACLKVLDSLGRQGGTPPCGRPLRRPRRLFGVGSSPLDGELLHPHPPPRASG